MGNQLEKTHGRLILYLVKCSKIIVCSMMEEQQIFLEDWKLYSMVFLLKEEKIIR